MAGSAVQQPLVIRLPAYVRVGIFGMALVVLFVSEPAWIRNSEGDFVRIILCAVFGAFFLAFCWRAFAMRVVAGPNSVEVRDLKGTRRIPATHVQEIEIGRRSVRLDVPNREAKLRLTDGEVVPLYVTQCLWLFPWTRANFRRKVDSLREWHASVQ